MLACHESDRSRDFICPCGKGYFSYAALFTHVKQKHDGKVLRLSCSHPGRSSSPSPNTRGDGPGRHPSWTLPPSYRLMGMKEAWRGGRKPSLLLI
jgi:hypothetical protein